MKTDFLKNTYKNISGITVIDSNKPGKCVGIFAVTHGNEPVGLDIFEYLVNDYGIENKLISGKLFLVAVNIEAYEKYILEDNIDKYRFIDDNMNRISNKDFRQDSSEFKRLEELKPIFDEIDVVIDLHSISKGNELIGITDFEYFESAKAFFDTEIILVDDIGKTGAVIGQFLRNNKKAYGIECGNHIDESGLKNGISNVLNFLKFHRSINYEIIKKNNNPDIFEFFIEIKPETDHFYFTSDFKGFTKIENNETFAVDGGLELKNIGGENIYIGMAAKNPKKGDGAGFLFKKLN